MKTNDKTAQNQPLQLHDVSCWAFNLNETILVKIHDKGYQHMADNHNKYLGVVSNWERRTAEYYKSKADENGYTKMQAWCFIEEFGSVTSIGFHGYYSTDILIRSEHLKPCS
jgi:hypothetical protein